LGGDLLSAGRQGLLEVLAIVFCELLNHSKLGMSWNDSNLQVRSRTLGSGLGVWAKSYCTIIPFKLLIIRDLTYESTMF
jgi:hypothetical protein